VILLNEHVCFNEKRLDGIEGRLREVEISQAEQGVIQKNMAGDISEIKTILSDLPAKQAATWEMVINKTVERLSPKTQSLNPIVFELIKLTATALVIIGALVGVKLI
jgi:hypothetical protein